MEPAEKFTMRMLMVRPDLATHQLSTKWSSHWGNKFKRSHSKGVEFIQLVYCIIIYPSYLNCGYLHIRSTVVALDTGTPGTSREIYSEDADGETRTRNPSVINRVL